MSVFFSEIRKSQGKFFYTFGLLPETGKETLPSKETGG